MNFPPLFISCMDWGIYMWSSRDHFTISGNVELARIFKSIGIVKPQGESAIGIHRSSSSGQKTTKFCKVIILQSKKKKKIYIYIYNYTFKKVQLTKKSAKF